VAGRQLLLGLALRQSPAKMTTRQPHPPSGTSQTIPLHMLLVLLALAAAPACKGHGYLQTPRSHNWAAYEEGCFYDPQSGNGLGVSAPP
jgi:hypothetical protein